MEQRNGKLDGSSCEVRMKQRFSRRDLLRSAGIAGSWPGLAMAQQTGAALVLARILNQTIFNSLPPIALQPAKNILARPFASPSAGTHIGSAPHLREFAKGQG